MTQKYSKSYGVDLEMNELILKEYDEMAKAQRIAFPISQAIYDGITHEEYLARREAIGEWRIEYWDLHPPFRYTLPLVQLKDGKCTLIREATHKYDENGEIVKI